MDNQKVKTPWWLWPNLLSLDAPLVAVVWLFLFVDTWRIYWFPWQAYPVLFGVVWCIYSADRVLDALRLKGTDMIQPRHIIHYRLRYPLSLLWLIIFTACLSQIIWFPASTIEYGVIGVILIGIYFILATKQKDGEIPLIKNSVAGITFAYGTSICALIQLPQTNWFTLLSGEFHGIPAITGYALLCVLNITAIDFWQVSRASNDPETKAEIELAYASGLLLLMIGMMTFCITDTTSSRYFYYAIMMAASSLLFISKIRSRLSLDLLRVLADAVLILPLPFYLLMKAFA